MSTIPETVMFPRSLLPEEWSLADVRRHVGDVPLARIRSYPPPGMATEEDLLEARRRESVVCELIDGVLVEKPMGTYESALAVLLASFIQTYLDEHPIGFITGEAGFLRILPRRTRAPDVSVILWERLPDQRMPADAVFRVAPHLAVEILSEGNTAGEIEMKLSEYRRAGINLVWIIDPVARTATVHTLAGQTETLDENGVLDGGDVLPGFQLPLTRLLDRYPRA
jgi:Uma2 family endonuclease